MSSLERKLGRPMLTRFADLRRPAVEPLGARACLARSRNRCGSLSCLLCQRLLGVGSLEGPPRKTCMRLSPFFDVFIRHSVSQVPFFMTLLGAISGTCAFLSVSEVMTIMHRFVARTGTVMRGYPSQKSGWLGAFRKGLLDLGWSEARTPWTWWHAEMDDVGQYAADAKAPTRVERIPA